MDTSEPESEIAINATIDGTPVLADVPSMAPPVLWAFCVDVAQNIESYDVLAARYGFDSWQSLQGWLATNAPVRKKIKEIRAVWASDDNIQTRIRTLAGHSVLEALPYTARRMFDDRIPDATRVDFLKQHARIAGVDGLPPAVRDGGIGGGAPGIGRFSVNIVFPNAGRVESFTTVEHEPEED